MLIRAMIQASCRPLAAVALGCAAAAVGPPVQAADPLRGAALYATPPRAGLLACADCHSADPGVNNFGNIFVGRNAVELIQRAVGFNTGGMGYFASFYGTGDLADIAAFLGNSPASLAFADTFVGSVTTPQRVTVRASTKIGLTSISVRVDGGDDFRILPGGCGDALAARDSCFIDVAFAPTGAGPRSARLLIGHSGLPSPVQVPLSGAAAARPTGNAVPRPAALTFGTAGERRVVSVSNTEPDPVAIRALTAWPGHFSVQGGSCAPGTVLAGASSCTVAVGFEPLGVGAVAGELRIEHDGAGGRATVVLSGRSDTPDAPRIVVDGASIDFGGAEVATNLPARLLTYANAGDRPLQWVVPTSTDSAFGVEASTCLPGSTWPAGARCQIAVAFRPGRAGPISGSIVLAAGGSSTVNLPVHGRGTIAQALLTSTTRQLVFVGAPGYPAPAQRATLVNRGSAAVTVRGVELAGTQAGAFSVEAGGDCIAGQRIAPGASCSLSVRIEPALSGSRSARLTIDHDGPGAPVSIDLAGRHGATPGGIPWLDAAQIDFGDQPSGIDGETRSVELRNIGVASLALRSLSVTGDHAADFPLAGDCVDRAELGPAASCALVLRFAPRAAGHRRASLVIDTGQATAAVVELSGRARAQPMPALALSALVADFGNRVPGAAAARRTLRLSNPGSTPIRILGLGVDPPFALTGPDTCRRTLAPGQGCDAEVSFAPPTTGEFVGRLSVHADDAAAPRMVVLTGRATTTAAALRWSDGAIRSWAAAAQVDREPSIEAITLTNDGNAATTMSFAVSGPAALDFSLEPTSPCLAAQLQPGQSCVARVRFHPTSAGWRQAELHAIAEGRSQARIALEARALGPASGRLALAPTAIDWSAVPGRASPPQRLVIANTGAGELAIQSLGIQGAAFAILSTTDAACSSDGFVLLPGDRCVVDVAWSGSAAASGGGAVVLTLGDADTTAVALSVSEDPQLRSNVGRGAGAMGWWFATGLALAAAAMGRRAKVNRHD